MFRPRTTRKKSSDGFPPHQVQRTVTFETMRGGTSSGPSVHFKLQRADRSLLAAVLVLGHIVSIGCSTDDSPSANGGRVERPKSFSQLDRQVAQLIDRQLEHINQDLTDANRRARLGLIYEANELWQDAFDTFGDAVAMQPDEPTWRYHWAMNAHEVGEFDVAHREIARLVRDSPELTVGWQRYGQQRLEAGDLQQACRAFEQVIEQRPSASAGYVGLADVRLREERNQDAIRLARKAIELEPHDKVAHFLLGQALMRAGETREAERYLRFGVGGAIRYLPDPMSDEKERLAVNLKARTSRGMRLLVAGKTQAAAQVLAGVLRDDPENVSVMNNLAGAYVRLGKTKEAYTLLQRAKNSPDQKASTYVNLANYYVMKGDIEVALLHATRGVELDPRSELAHRARASVLFHLERYSEALINADEASRLNPSSIAILRQAGDLALRAGEFAEAVQYYQSLTRLAPDELSGWLGLAKSAIGKQDAALAETAAAEAQRIAPNDPSVRRIVRALER